MGLADELFKGAGLGLAQGVQGYNQGLEQQQQAALRKQEAERQMQLFAMQKQQHDFDQAYKKNALVKADMSDALTRHDNQAAAGFMGDLNTSRQGMGLAALPLVVGSPVAGVPAQAATPMGPQYSGEPMGLAARPAVPAHNDFSGAQTFNALAAAAGYAPPEPKIQTAAPGTVGYHWDPQLKKTVQDFAIPERALPFNLGPEQVRYDAQGGIIARGPAKTFPLTKPGRHVVNGVLVDDDGNPIYGTPRPVPDANAKAIQAWEKGKADATARARYRYEQTHKVKDNRNNLHPPDAAEVDAEEKRAGAAYERDHPRPSAALPVPPVAYNDTRVFDRVERVGQQIEQLGLGTVSSRARSNERDAIAKRENGVPAGRNNHGNRNVLDFVPAPGKRGAAEEFFKARGGEPEWHGTHLHVTFPQIQSALPMSDALAAFYDKHGIIPGGANA